MASSTTKDHQPATAPAQFRPPFSSSSSSPSATQPAEDESLKKNTDCVYFLASPLTCKKGSECEYRHSEYARINPRDCWFWLNGNCLNPKCSFRHPPLDPLLGGPVDSSGGSSVPGSSGAAAGPLMPPLQTVPSAPHSTAKATPPCIFFQKGYCLKGDRCPFSHMQNPTSNKAPESPAANLSESSILNNASGGLKKCSQLKIDPQANLTKPTKLIPPQPKTSVHAVKTVPRNGAFAEKCGMPRIMSNEDARKHKETTLDSLNNGNSRTKSASASQASSLDEQRLQSGREADDLLRESSPGFDVLVDNELRDAEYYGNEDQFPRIRGHERRNLNEFESGHLDGYNSVDDVDPGMYHHRHGYDKYESVHERHARDYHCASSERSCIEGSQFDLRGAYKRVSPGRVEHSDLRHRLSKQRRVNGLRSVVNPDYASDVIAKEHSYRSAGRDTHHAPPGGSSFSSRLQGRVKLPRQSSPLNPSIEQSDREYDRGRHRARLSPSRPQHQSHQGRLQDRLRGKIQDNIDREITSKRDMIDNNSFAGPKSLAELKRAKQSDSRSQEVLKIKEITSVVKRKGFESSQHTEDDLSFEGPKPLSEILKKKRKAEAVNPQSGTIFGAEEESKSSKTNENAVEKQEANKEEQNKPKEDPVLAPKQEASFPTYVVPSKPVAAEESETKLTETQTSLADNVLESKEGLVTDGVEDHEVEDEYYEEGDGGYEEEEVDGEGGHDLDEGEDGELPDDFMDEDEEDSFAKKMGFVLS